MFDFRPALEAARNDPRRGIATFSKDPIRCMAASLASDLAAANMSPDEMLALIDQLRLEVSRDRVFEAEFQRRLDLREADRLEASGKAICDAAARLRAQAAGQELPTTNAPTARRKNRAAADRSHGAQPSDQGAA